MGKRTTTQGACARPGLGRSPRPAPHKASSVSFHDEGSTQCFSHRLDPPISERATRGTHTHTTVAGTRGGHRVKGRRHHRSASGT